jgi:hypothetical protein
MTQTITTEPAPATTTTPSIPPARAEWHLPGRSIAFTVFGERGSRVTLAGATNDAAGIDNRPAILAAIRRGAEQVLDSEEGRRLEKLIATLNGALSDVRLAKDRIANLEQQRRTIDALDPKAAERLAELERELEKARIVEAGASALARAADPQLDACARRVREAVWTAAVAATRQIQADLIRQREAAGAEFLPVLAPLLNKLLAIDAAILTVANPSTPREAIERLIPETSGSAVGCADQRPAPRPVQPMMRCVAAPTA